MLLQLEDYGFCAKGEGGAFAASGEIELGGALPINTGGGHLSEGYIHGMNHVVEGVRQIRGDVDLAGPRRRGLPRHVYAAAPGERPHPDGRVMDVGTPPRPVPVDDDHDTGGFFAAARRGELVVRVCNGCDAVLHLPRAYCHTCGSWDGRWQPVSGEGRVYSWTTVDHQVHPAFPMPYTIVLVELDDRAGGPSGRLSARSTGAGRRPAAAGALRGTRRRCRPTAMGAGMTTHPQAGRP